MSTPDWAELRRCFPMAEQSVYLDGNSLGLCSRDAAETLQQRLQEWQQLGIGGWTGADIPWLRLARHVAGLMAPVVGADPSRLWVGGTTTLMLHQLLATLWKPASGRDQILMEGGAFPTDAYAAASHQRLRGLDGETSIITVDPHGDVFDEQDFIDAMDQPGVGCVLLPAIVYTTGQWLDMPRITEAARERGLLMLWDCSHAAGAVPLELDNLDADGAFWCGYKYLNGGPGAVAGAYLHPRHADAPPGLAGWFGSSDDALFKMDTTMTPAPDATRMNMGTPHVLSLGAMVGALTQFSQVPIDVLRERSLQLTDYLIEQADARLASAGFTVATPREHARRGGHVSLRHENAKALVEDLASRNIVTDFRYPDICRVAPVAMYNPKGDVDAFVDAALQCASA